MHIEGGEYGYVNPQIHYNVMTKSVDPFKKNC